MRPLDYIIIILLLAVFGAMYFVHRKSKSEGGVPPPVVPAAPNSAPPKDFPSEPPASNVDDAPKSFAAKVAARISRIPNWWAGIADTFSGLRGTWRMVVFSLIAIIAAWGLIKAGSSSQQTPFEVLANFALSAARGFAYAALAAIAGYVTQRILMPGTDLKVEADASTPTQRMWLIAVFRIVPMLAFMWGAAK